MSTHKTQCVVCGADVYCSSDVHALGCGGDGSGGCERPPAIEFCSLEHAVELRRRIDVAVQRYQEERDMGEGKLRQVGSLWKPKPGANSFGSGYLTINGLQQRFVVLANDRKKSDKAPDFRLMSSDEPTVDTYAADSQQARQSLGERDIQW